jgi:hypothetical protein
MAAGELPIQLDGIKICKHAKMGAVTPFRKTWHTIHDGSCPLPSI